MTSSISRHKIGAPPLARKITFDADNMWVDLADGRQLGVPLAYFPRLVHATAKQRKKYIISGGGAGLHWDDLDEDISVQGLLMGVGDLTARHAHREVAA
ncbi:MAG: DUF2442 domain-containing protein [Candidatus Sumerlaeota bacterium]|nr:DUF2442 domain-containing protein [Candidatus Sumerlaeota bacterium]